MNAFILCASTSQNTLFKNEFVSFFTACVCVLFQIFYRIQCPYDWLAAWVFYLCNYLFIFDNSVWIHFYCVQVLLKTPCSKLKLYVCSVSLDFLFVQLFNLFSIISSIKLSEMHALCSVEVCMYFTFYTLFKTELSRWFPRIFHP